MQDKMKLDEKHKIKGDEIKRAKGKSQHIFISLYMYMIGSGNTMFTWDMNKTTILENEICIEYYYW